MKRAMTAYVDGGTLDEVRDAVIHTQGPPLRTTLSSFTEAALKEYLVKFRRKHNGNQPWPETDRAVKTGRPLG